MNGEVLSHLGEDDAWAILANPSAAAEQVRDIAHTFPDMRAAAANHPAAYPALLDWLDHTGDPMVSAAVARRRDHDARMTQPPRALGMAVSAPARRASDKPARRPSGAGWAVLGFLVPLVGLILWIVWADAEPRRARKARNGFVASLVVGVLIVGLLIAGVLLQGTPQDAAAIPPPAPVAVTSVDPPDGDAQHAWITVPSPKRSAGALVVDVHTDYQCPTCQIMEKVYGPMLAKLSDAGSIIWRQHSRIAYDQVLGNDSSLKASVAAACMDVADSSKYIAYHLMIFANQPRKGTGFSDSDLRDKWPAAVGLSGASLAVFQNCYDNQATKVFIQDGEQSNLQATLNQSPPNVYTFGGNKPNRDADGACTGAIGIAVGVCDVPDFYVQGIEFTMKDLFKADFTPKFKSADTLLAMLRRIAAGK